MNQVSEECHPFILDAGRSPDGISLWEIRDGELIRTNHPYQPSFLVSFPDPHLHYSLIDGLESAFPMKECTIKTIYGDFEGYSVKAGREVAEKIEQQTRHQVRLYNVDIRPEQRFCAEHGIVMGGLQGSDRFLPELEFPFVMMEISCNASPHRSDHPGTMKVKAGDRPFVLEGPERQIIGDLFDIVQSSDPDVILFPDYDNWSARICAWADEWGMQNTLSRSGKFRSLSSRSYFSYGRMEHRLGARMPEGRLIIDTRQSFMYREGDIRGILLASRLTGLSPNLTCRLTPGTLVSSYEVYEALVRGIAVPFRKSDAEAHRNLEDMRLDYRGGLTLQPDPGVYEGVIQIDFTSFYPSIIVKYNLSPETIGRSDREGFLATVLGPLLMLRLETKRRKKDEHRFAGMDDILKWMLVTCFGYTGYKNARFGRIEVHENITLKATEILQDCISLIKEMDGKVLHAIIDCLFVQQCSPADITRAVEERTGFHTEYETYDWIVFLPQADGTGSYGNYYGRLRSGEMKYRGVAARRRNSPPYIQKMQKELFTLMATAYGAEELVRLQSDARAVHSRYRDGIADADTDDLVITRRIGRDAYRNRCIAQAVLETYQAHGIDLKPGMDASYIVRDEKRIVVDPSFDPQGVDIGHYRRLIDKAWKEVDFAFRKAGP